MVINLSDHIFNIWVVVFSNNDANKMVLHIVLVTFNTI